MQVTGLNALSDNYIWVIHNEHQAWVVDPGESHPVLAFLSAHNLVLKGILITHHHYDHTDGVENLIQAFPDINVYAGTQTEKPYITHRLKQGDQIVLANKTLQIIETPGHTLDHIAYVSDQWLFCGDTLFTGGCGRVFEGTAQQMSDSLLKLRSLDDQLLVYCGHEYTLTNLNFARIAEPQNPEIETRYKIDRQKRINNQPCVPSNLHQEKLTNPFLRFDLEPLSGNITQRMGRVDQKPTQDQLFAELRAWKDSLDKTGELEEPLD